MSKKNKINVVLIDDESNALMGLETMIIEYCDQLNIAGKAESAFHGLKLIKENLPDLVFLDVEMPGASGFDLLDEMPEPKPLVIFTTAHEKHAIKAINAMTHGSMPAVRPTGASEMVSNGAAACQRMTRLRA